MPWTAEVHKQVLPNGLTILVQRDTSAPVVAVVTHIKAGYFDEPDEWTGIAHVLEHMFFKGTARRGPGEIARETQCLGGYLNAGTIYDKTVYHTVLPSNGLGLERALDIQADALINAALDEKELVRELEVIVQEAKRKLDSPPAVTAEALYELLFSTHRMRRWRIGTEAGLRRLTPSDVREYHTTRYAPGRTIVGIASDLDSERAMDMARQVYAGWERPAREIAGSPPEPPGANPRLRTIAGDVTRPLAAIGWRTVGTLHPDAVALDMAASVLGAGRGSRLYRAVRAPGLASTVHASHYTPTDVGVFDVALAGDGDRLDDAVERSIEVVQSLIDAGPDESDMDRSRALAAMHWARQFESMDGRAAALCQAEALGGYELADDLYNRQLGVSASDVQRVARQYLDPAAGSAVFYLHAGGTTRLAAGSWPFTPGSAAIVGAVEVRHALGGAPPAVQPVAGAAEYDFGVERRSYRGVDLLARSKRGASLVSIGVHVPDLPGRETLANAGVSRLLLRSTLRGAAGMDSEALALAAELLGGGISTGASVDGVGWGLTVRPEAVPEAARLLRLVALEPTLADGDIAIEREVLACDARRMRDDMFRHPIDRVVAQAFPGDTYGLPAMGVPETVETMSAGTVRAWGERLQSHRAVVVAVGDLEAGELLDALEPLADWPALENPALLGGDSPDFACGCGVEQRDKAQTALAFAFPAPPVVSADRYALTVVGVLLSGMAGRLFEELREKRSLAYTVSASPWLKRRAGLVLAYVATSPEREAEARDVLLRELNRLFKDSVSDDELTRARNYAAGSVEIGRQSASSVASEILGAWVYGTIEELAETAGRLRAVTAEDVALVVRKVFGDGRRAEYAVRGSGKSR